METVDSRKVVRYSWESLVLPCEWGQCTVSETSMPVFMTHVLNDHISLLSELELQCYWRDCEHLSKSLPELRRHILYHAFHTKIKCLGKNFQLRKKFASCLIGTRSRNVIPELPEPFMCSWDDCREVFESPEFFYNHINFHATSSSYEEVVLESKEIVKCHWLGCKGTYTDQYKLKDHIKSHSQEKLIACPTCGNMFTNRTKFQDHLMRQKPIKKDEAYVCEYCNSVWGTERLLRDHMSHHVNHYKCPYCDMTCPTPSALRVHIDYRHSDVKSLTCEYCDYKCKRQNDLQKHLTSHSETPPFICQENSCNFSTRTSSNYRDHLLLKHKNMKRKQYSCHLCSKITIRGNYLTQHLTKKHNLCWPSGHCRFRYRQHNDGFYRLETVRYESSELSEAVLCDNDEEKIDDPSICISNSLSGSNIVLNNVTEMVATNLTGNLSSEEGVLTENSSLPVIMYMNSENSEEPVAAIISSALTQYRDIASDSDLSRQKSVILHIVDSSGNPVTFGENSILLSESINDISSLQSSEQVEQSRNETIQYQTM